MRQPAKRCWSLGGALLGVLGLGSAGCDFFKELESVPETTATDTQTDSESGGADTEATEAAPCTLADDDRCLNQDTVQSCTLTDGIVREIDCPALCGEFTNFSCVATGSGQHACWCVEPGSIKVLTCYDLEACLAGCPLDSMACADQCFGRTDATTIRIYGALVHCAENSCETTCADVPEACAACVDAARIEGSGGCSLPRAVCDADRDPDQPWP